MFHQRNIIKLYMLFAAVCALPLTAAIGSLFVSIIIVAIFSMPIVFVIKKIFPAPDWYANEAGNTGVTSMNLTSRDVTDNK